jgi:L-threonylcarbamoyladenylate synthase
MTNIESIIKILNEGGIGVMPTDTIYGLLGSALNQKTVERIYQVRKRRPDKPFIILISSLKQLAIFGIKITKEELVVLKKYWPGKVSFILSLSDINGPAPGSRVKPGTTNRKSNICRFEYLHRGANSLAFRLPKSKQLQEILEKTGPLVAPSANPEGFPPAKNITEAKKYFSGQVDFYSSDRIYSKQPSTLVELKNGKVNIIREGIVKINQKK